MTFSSKVLDSLEVFHGRDGHFLRDLNVSCLALHLQAFLIASSMFLQFIWDLQHVLKTP